MNKTTALAFLTKLAEGSHTEAEYRLFLNFLEQCDTADYSEILDHWEQCLETEPIRGQIRRQRWGIKRMVATAAAVIAVISAGYFIALQYSQKDGVSISSADLAKTILPADDRTLLTLDDGTQVPLDSVTHGNLLDLGTLKLVKTADGALSYEASAKATGKNPSYHTLTTSRGGHLQVVLPDGTSVWLNASSSLRFPTQFNGAQRLVELTGEGYFEVSGNPKKPFVVKTPSQRLTVLGTYFNINAYADEPKTTTTVLEGSVRVEPASMQEEGAFAILRKGQQAQLASASNEIRVRDVQEQHSIAWRNGRFQFDNTPIDEVMRQFSRWYTVDFEYAGGRPPVKLWGNINKDVNAAEALEIIRFFELDYVIEAHGDEKKIIVFHETGD